MPRTMAIAILTLMFTVQNMKTVHTSDSEQRNADIVH